MSDPAFQVRMLLNDVMSQGGYAKTQFGDLVIQPAGPIECRTMTPEGDGRCMACSKQNLGQQRGSRSLFLCRDTDVVRQNSQAHYVRLWSLSLEPGGFEAITTLRLSLVWVKFACKRRV